MIAPERGTLIVFDDDVALARAAAENFAECARTAIAARGVFAVALAGGSTPKATYALLATTLREAVEWPRVRFFFGDERCVSPSDPASNYGMAKRAMFDPLQIPDAAIFRIRGESNPAAAAREYAAILRCQLGEMPMFDLVMLGMGPDGHTASLFPGTDPLADDELLVRSSYVETLASARITVTPRVINSARAVSIATAGEAKAAALAAVLGPAPDPVRYPIAIVRPGTGRLVWLVDRAAAKELAVG